MADLYTTMPNDSMVRLIKTENKLKSSVNRYVYLKKKFILPQGPASHILFNLEEK